MPESTVPAYITSLIRHFEDLRDGTHGGSSSRADKEAHFGKAVQLVAPIARQVLTEMNSKLLLDRTFLQNASIAHGSFHSCFSFQGKGPLMAPASRFFSG